MSYAISLPLPKANTQTDPVFRYICTGVIVLHVVLIFWMSLQKMDAPIIQKPVEKLIVKTINLNEGIRVKQTPQKAIVAAAPAIIEEPEPIVEEPEPVVEPEIEDVQAEPEPEIEGKDPKPEPEPQAEPIKPKREINKTAPKKPDVKKPLPKKETPKKPTLKKETSKKKETPKKPAPKKKDPFKPAVKKDPAKKSSPDKPKSDPKAEAMTAKKRELFAKAQASLAKADVSRSNLSSVASTSGVKNLSGAGLPATIGSLSVDSISSEDGSSLSVREMGYRSELASRLRALLKLPEHGDVKIKLKLDRSGKFLSVSIVSSKNSANKKYIEKTLPTLTFPSFGSNFSGQQDYTFLITLSNDL